MTNKLFFLFFISITFIFSAFGQSSQAPPSFQKPTVDDDDNYTSVGNIGLTVTNYAVFGDGFVQQAPVDQPSCEYPRGSKIEHIFDGGLWVGAETPAGIRVSTGAFNSARIGSAGSINYEFTNTADPTDRILERSSLPQNKFYSPEAISHQDFVIDFADTNILIPGTPIPIPQHNPLGIAVHLETYAWNFPFADAFVIFNYNIRNVGYQQHQDTLKNVYVGLWADMVVRNTNILPPRVGAPFYQDVSVGFINDPEVAKLIYAFEPENGATNTNANSYVALVYLGAEKSAADTAYHGEMNYNWWYFSGGTEDWQAAPNTDALKYARMQQNIQEEFSDFNYSSDIAGQVGNFMNLMCTGPFGRIPPDSSINVAFAVVCGKKYGSEPISHNNENTRRNLIENVSWAQRAYYGEDVNHNGVLDFVGTDSTEDLVRNGKLDRYILPTPPAVPHLKVIPENGKVTLLWDLAAEESIDLISRQKDFEGYRVYRSFLGNDRSDRGIFENMELIHEYDRRDGFFYDTGLEAIKMPQPVVEIEQNPDTGSNDTITYQYKLEVNELHNGWQYAFSVTAFDSGDVSLNLPSLEGSRLENVVVVSPGTPARENPEEFKVGVYPNPYRVGALWDGNFERERKLYFYNLPARSQVRIYTLAGDMVDSFIHEGGSYTGADIQWYQKYSQGNTVFPGGEHAWDLVTDEDQAIATGLYLFTVKDLKTGEVQRGKFVIIK